jgi:ABC-type transport system involved in multi-copper enzyme maturation permease subunit
MNTWREAIRDRIYLALVSFAVLLFGITQIISPLALGEGDKITRDFGLTALTLLGVLIIIMVGTGLVQKELERKTIMTLLSKPLGRGEFIVGKFTGLLMTLALLFAGMLVLLMALIWIREGGWDTPVLLAGCLSAGELVIMTAVAIFFSTCASPTLSGLFTFAAFFMGHFSADLLVFATQAASPVLAWVLKGSYFIFPNLELFNARSSAVHGVAPTGLQFALGLGYMTVYVAAVMTAAVLIFRNREFR